MSVALQAALDALSAGISVWPPRQDGTKAPDGPWKSGQLARASEEQILAWYAGGRTGVGWVTGAVSGGLEVIDFDDRSTWAEYQRLAKEAGLAPLLERVAQGYLEHTPNGAHLPYRCATIEGNQKLACRASDRKALIETRGEGGFVIVAPSSGGVNLKGSYGLQSGGVETIATISPSERKALFDLARIFDEAAPVEAAPPRTLAPVDGTRPGDSYNASASWDELLTAHGWTRVSARLGVVSWRRPGKDIGISATTNHAGSDLLYVFSSSTAFEQGRGYSKFSAYALLEHGGDFGAAAAELALRGYGLEVPHPEVDLSALLESLGRPRLAVDAVAPDPVVEDLLRVPGLVGELAEWIDETSHRRQPILSIGASIAALGTILGRRVRTESDLRTNVYVLGVAETGAGKERARQAVGELFAEIGRGASLGDSFASDSAVERAVFTAPSCLYLIDEMGRLLETVRDERAPAHLKNIVSVLLRMYSCSDGIYRRRIFASVDPSKAKEPTEIEQPCLSLYGTTVPSNLYSSLTKAQMSDGFLSRLLVFESTDPDPLPQTVDVSRRTLPASVVEGYRHWDRAPINATEGAGNIERVTRPAPLVVWATKEAVGVFADLESTMRARRAEERAQGRDQGPFTRVVASAWKLALIRACGVALDRPEITAADAAWGASLAWGLTAAFLERVRGRVHENRQEDYTARVLELVRSVGRIGHSDLVWRTRWLTRQQRGDILATLAEGGLIVVDEEQTATRPRRFYRPGIIVGNN